MTRGIDARGCDLHMSIKGVSSIVIAQQHSDTPLQPAIIMTKAAALLLVAVLGAAAFTPAQLFGPPRTRAQALAYAKKALLKDADKDSANVPVPRKGSRQGRVDMVLDPGYVPGQSDPLLPHRPTRQAHDR